MMPITHLDVSPGCSVTVVGELGRYTGVVLHVDGEALLGEVLHHGGNHGNTTLILYQLLRHADRQLLVRDTRNLELR